MAVRRVVGLVRDLAEDRAGAAMLDYALLAALVAMVAIGSLTTLGTSISTQFANLGTSV